MSDKPSCHNRQAHLHGGCSTEVWLGLCGDNRKLMDRTHSECLKYASENEYVQVRYAQGNWQTRDTELILYLEVPGKPSLVGVGLTERAVRCLRELLKLDREIQDMTTTISRAGAMMRVAAGRDDIPCCAFVPPGDAPSCRPISVGPSLLPIRRSYVLWSTSRAVYCPRAA